MQSLSNKYSNIICLDFETTGLYPNSCEIIDFGLCLYSLDDNGQYVLKKEINELMRTSSGLPLPNEIVRLTHITDQMLFTIGRNRKYVIDLFINLIDECIKDNQRVLISTYNANFDLGFLEHELRKYAYQTKLKYFDYLDILTIYKDRRAYPHRLLDAINSYQLNDKVKNSHRAYDDAAAAFAVLEAMGKEKDDLDKYINLFGYNPKYGIPKYRIDRVTYKPHYYNNTNKLYQ